SSRTCATAELFSKRRAARSAEPSRGVRYFVSAGQPDRAQQRADELAGGARFGRRAGLPALEVVVVAASGRDHPALPDRIGPHPLRMVQSDVRLSRPQAANAGLDAARGDWITFLDDDDLLLSGHVSGLDAARRNARGARLIYTLALGRFADGHTETWGRPYALSELYERNFIHLSTALFARSLVADGCRFDEAFEIMQDWDFFLQCAQLTPFHFEPRQTF